MSICVISGCNRGIGLELTRQLAARGETVIGLCRKASDDLKALSIELIEGFELTDEASYQNLGARLDHRPIKLLINNAGRLRRDTFAQPNDEELRLQFEINAIAPLRLTRELSTQLMEGAKIAHITSRMGSIADNTSGSMYGYRMSKAALNAAGKSMAVDLAPRGISVAILHPGFVRTGMTGGNGLIDAPESAAGLLARIDELTLETSGTFWHMNGEILPW